MVGGSGGPNAAASGVMFAASSADVVFNLQLCMRRRGFLLLNHLFHELLAQEGREKKVSKRLLEAGCVNAATH